MDQYLDGLIVHFERNSCEVGVMAILGILHPQASILRNNTVHTKLKILEEKFCFLVDFGTDLEEWASFKEQVVLVHSRLRKNVPFSHKAIMNAILLF